MAKLPAKVRPGDPIFADDFNAIAEALERFLNLDVSAGGYLRMEKGSTGIALSLAVPRGIWAKLSGASSPYSWEEVEPLSGGGWGTFGGRTGTADAYEVNAKANLADKVVHLRRTGAGDWRFVWLGVGPPTCTGHGNTLTFSLSGCAGSPVSGASVTMSSGADTYTGTTDGSGVFAVTDPAPGAYTISWSYGSFSGTRSATITTSCNSASANDNLINSVPSGWRCCAGCLIPLPGPIYWTDATGTYPMIASGTGWVPLGSDYSEIAGKCVDNRHVECDGTVSYTYYNLVGGICQSQFGGTTVFGTTTGTMCSDPWGITGASLGTGPLGGSITLGP